MIRVKDHLHNNIHLKLSCAPFIHMQADYFFHTHSQGGSV